MWEEVFSVALSNGIFACMFVILLAYELKDSRQREKRYQNTIDVLSLRLGAVEDIKDDVLEIRKIVTYKKGKKQNENI